MKLDTFVNLLPALAALNGERLPYKYALPFSILLKESQPKVKAHEEASKALVEQYAARDDKGQIVARGRGVQVPPENVQAFKDKLAELGDVEIEVTVPTIPHSVLVEVDERFGLSIEPQLLEKLLGVVVINYKPEAAAEPAKPVPAAKP